MAKRITWTLAAWEDYQYWQGQVRIPRNLDTDSTPNWTRIPGQNGQSERSDAGFWGFTLRMPLGSSFKSAAADAKACF